MYKIENKIMLEYLEKDIIKNIYICSNVVNAGKENYGIKEIVFYTECAQNYNEYVVFSTNIWDELIVQIISNKATFLDEIFVKIRSIFNNYTKIKIATSSLDLLTLPVLKKYFTIKTNSKAEYGVYACFSKSQIPNIELPDGVNIQVVKEPMQSEYSEYSDNHWDGLSSQIKYGKRSDLLFILKKDGNNCGYLLANCSYKNVYDVSNVFVLPEYRGNRYGCCLTVFFATFCFNNEFIPHCGTAVSKYSEQVALNSGFTEISRTYYVDIDC